MSSRSVIGRNILANTVGGSWVVVLSLVVIPFQIRLLGAEAYGLIGFLASLQGLLLVLDFGLSTTVNREIAGDWSIDRAYSRKLVETAASLYWIIAVALGIALAWAAPAISTRWLTLEVMTPQQAAGAIRIMAVWMALSWPCALYSSVLAGQQRLDIVNALRVGTASLGQGGGLIILLIWRDFYTFLYWTAAAALLSVFAHAVVCRRVSPWMSLHLRPSADVIRKIWRFSVDVNLITILAIVYSQLDRLLLARLLPLRMVGYYNAAYSLAKGIGVVQGFINSAMLPALASDFGHGRSDQLKARYSKYSQALVYLVALPAFFLLFYGFETLRYWATPEVADAGHRALEILAAGFLLNAAMSAPYTLAIATGHTRLPLVVNLIGVGVYVPALYSMTVLWGLEGAALAWLALNLYYVATLLPLTQRRIMQGGAREWLRRNVLPFALLSLAVFSISRMTIAGVGGQGLTAAVLGSATAMIVYVLAGYLLLGRELRKDVLATFSFVGAVRPRSRTRGIEQH